MQRDVSAVAALADLSEVLDSWADEARLTFVTLHPLRGALRDHGFVARAASSGGRVVAERVFLATDEGLRSLTNDEVRKLQRDTSSRWRRFRRHFARGFLLFVSAVAFVGCLSVPPDPSRPTEHATGPRASILVGGCPLITPNFLPSGALPGEPRPAGKGRFEWGSGQDRVTEAIGVFGIGDPDEFRIPPDSQQWVNVRGVRALVVPVGDEAAEIAFTWQAGDCPYTVWLAPGHTLAEAITYAAGY